MIHVHRDFSIIPDEILSAARKATAELEDLPAEARPQYIRDNSPIWRAFSRYLAKMSYNKCWYSESPEVQSPFDVDHFRPKLRAKRSSKVSVDGYQWLAFAWDNFRLSAQKSNRLNINPDTAHTDGKGDWFELMPGSRAACWENRCDGDEEPVLLDPVKPTEVRLIDVLADGRMGASWHCVGSAGTRVKRSIELYGLNLPDILRARRQVIREIRSQVDVLRRCIAVGADADPMLADALPISEQIDAISARTHPRSPYSRAARAELYRLGVGELCLSPEEIDRADDD